jgi:anthranilate phosphoribosyltransferase
VYGAALCLWHLGRHGSLKEAADAVRGVLDNGQALARLHQAI